MDARHLLAIVLVASSPSACHWVFPYQGPGADGPDDAGREHLRLDGGLESGLDAPSLNPGILDVSVGFGHTCAVKRNGELWCWGWNEWGMLGDGSRHSVAVPTRALLSNVGSVSACVNHTCAVTGQGTLYCWGYNGSGHLGISGTTTQDEPQEVVKLRDVLQVATGNHHTCARSASEVWCWGNNASGEAGQTSTDADFDTPQPVPVTCTPAQLALGYSHSCVRCAEGSVLCWGSNDVGQLGDGSNAGRATPAPVKLSGGSPLVDATGIWAGAESSCAVREGGEVVCWGGNTHGQVDGSAPGKDRTEAVAVSGLTDVVEVAPGERHTCALGRGGGVYCWGSNLLGQLGDGAADSPSPRPVPSLSGVIRLSGSGRTTCALTSSAISCWGAYGRGQIGDGRHGYVLTPRKITFPSPGPAIDLDAGEGHACAVLASGALYCWGSNSSGAGGSDPRDYVLAGPTPVNAPSATAVTAGYSHSCAVTGPQAYCWGDNRSGQLGDGTRTARFKPAAVLSPTNCPGAAASGVLAVAAGEYHTCLRSSGDVISCAGGNYSGQVGQPLAVDSTPCPKPVSALLGKVVAVGDTTSCVLTGAELKCWGSILGVTGYPFTATPAPIFKTTSATTMSVGRSHGCLASDGVAVCWGSGADGRLGNGSSAALSAPDAQKPVVDGAKAPVAKVVSVSASPGVGVTGAHGCAAAESASYCWGWNEYGQLGDGTRITRLNAGAPILDDQKAKLVGAKVATGPHFSCAIDTKGQVWCWGYNGSGAVGLGPQELPVVRAPTEVKGL